MVRFGVRYKKLLKINGFLIFENCVCTTKVDHTVYQQGVLMQKSSPVVSKPWEMSQYTVQSVLPTGSNPTRGLRPSGWI